MTSSESELPPTSLHLSVGGGIVVPNRLLLEWPESAEPGTALLDALDPPDGGSPDLARTLQSLPALLRGLDPWHRRGAAVLAPWSLRLHPDGTVTAWCVPGLGSTTRWPDRLAAAARTPGPRADVLVLGRVLFRLAAGFWAADDRRAVETAAILAGDWPLGVDTLVAACLHPTSASGVESAGALLDRVAPFLEVGGLDAVDPTDTAGTAGGPEPETLRIADESVTGWTKSRNRPDGDNEDAVGWRWTPHGAVACVLDGVTGDGQGGGRWASRELRRTLIDAWGDGVHHPDQALRRAAAAMSAPPDGTSSDATTAGVVVRVDGTRLEWVVFGDCRGYLARPTADGPRVTRFTVEQSLVAQALRSGHSPSAEQEGVLTNAVPVPYRAVSRGGAALRPGDLVVLCSDGACSGGPGTVTGWRFVDDLTELLRADAAVNPAWLASRLCRRAEDLGGHDNATALVLSVSPPENPARAPGASRLAPSRPLVLPGEAP